MSKYAIIAELNYILDYIKMDKACGIATDSQILERRDELKAMLAEME